MDISFVLSADIMFHVLYIVLCLILPSRTYSLMHRDLVIQSLFENYSADIPPNYSDGSIQYIDVQIYILSIDSVSDTSKDYAISFFLRQRWKDSRLKYSKTLNLESLQLDSKSTGKVWVPDLYILNEKKGFIHDVVVPNNYIHIKPDGSVLYSIRISGRFSCDVDLLRYPLDHQICPLIIESYGYSAENLQLKWFHEPVEKKEDIILSQFSLGGIKTFKCDKEYAGMNFSCVQMNIKLDRLYAYHLVQTYIPAILIVILSWVSFWISIDATAARISLGLMTVLTLTTQNSGLPKVSYFKALDVWIVACLCFVFGALLEFAWVNVLSRVHQRRQSRHVNDQDRQYLPRPSTNGKADNNKEESRVNTVFKNMANREKARNVDRVSRILFPVTFVVFNIIYWTVYVFLFKTCTCHFMC